MSATDELRAELTKRGVEWRWENERTTYWYVTVDGEEWGEWTAIEMGGYLHLSFSSGDVLTPAQAIAATLGGEDTYTREDVEGAFVSGYSLGLDMFDSSKQEKGWNQNERNMDEEMEDLGWVRVETATLGRGECHDEGTFRSWGYFTCSNCKVVVPVEAVREAPSIGKVVPISFCPNCGRRVKVVDE